jgi:hypothetical protein
MSTYQDQFDKFSDTVWGSLPDFMRREGFKEELKLQLQSVNKRLGQIIAKSWLHESDSEGKKIRDVIIGNPNESIAIHSQKIINFFKQEYSIDLTRLVTGEGDTGLVERVVVDWNTFGGNLDESSRDYIFPYPPRPVEVTDEQLKAWIDDADPTHNYPTTPYIPLTGF